MLASKLRRIEEGQGFPSQVQLHPFPIWQQLFAIEQRLCSELTDFIMGTKLGSTTVIYDPLDYAQEVHCTFLQWFMNGRKDVLYLGMNPGHNGMCQNGVGNHFNYSHYYSPFYYSTFIHPCPSIRLPFRSPLETYPT